MSRILFIYENGMATVSLIKDSLCSSKFQIGESSRIISVRKISKFDLDEADIIILIRPTDFLSLKIACSAQKQGRFVITYCDDDLYNAPCNSFLDKSRVKFFRKVLAVSDIVLSSNPRVSEKYRKLSKSNRSAVVDTSIDENDIVMHKQDNEKVKIVYAAGDNHAMLFEKYISPILDDLIDAVGNSFMISFIGVHPYISKLKEDINIEYTPSMPLNEYRKYMKEQNFDIGLAPINDDEFSKCKYFNKFLEYTMCGIMGIYTDSEPYTYVVRNEQNGLLATTNPDDWLIKIQNAICNYELRLRCVKKAQNQIRNEFSFKANEIKLYNQIPELLTYKTQHNSIFSCAGLIILKVGYYFNQYIRFAFTGIGYLKSRGLKSLIQKMKIHYSSRKLFRDDI